MSGQGIESENFVYELFNKAAEIAKTVVCFEQSFNSLQVTAGDETDADADKAQQQSDAGDDAENLPYFTH